MNSKTYFIPGRRYLRNNGEQSYFVAKDDYTRSGCRYVYLREDLTGYEARYKVHIDNDGNEYVDLIGGAVKRADINEPFILHSSYQTSYIAMTNNEIKVGNGEEVEMSAAEIIQYLKKGVFADGQRFVLKKA
jgi:hypothetical protein